MQTKESELTACAPQVDVASPTLLFPLNRPWGPLLTRLLDGCILGCVTVLCCEGAAASSRGWGWSPSGVYGHARLFSLPAF